MERNGFRLKAIEIRGYRSVPYRAPLLLELGDVNILLGANGAGKSNIIGFFRMLEYMMRGQLQMYVASGGTGNRFLYYGPKKTPEMKASILFESRSDRCLYKFCLAAAVGDRLLLASEEIEWNGSGDENPLKINVQSDFNESGLIRSIEEREVEVRNMLGLCKVFQFSDSSSNSPLRQASPVISSHYLQSDGGNLASFLLYLKKNYHDSYMRISGYVREVVPQFQDFYLEPEEGYVSLKWFDTSINDYVLSADQFSDGSIRFIALATLLLQPAITMPFVIIIDEPELGMHPYAIDQLSEMITDASRHAQIMVATQSAALIDAFSTDDVTVIEYKDSIQGTGAHKLSEETYRDWLEEYSLSELWNKNVIGGRPR